MLVIRDKRLDTIFYDCEKLESIVIPSSITYIEVGVFDGCPNVTIHCEAGSAAESYAMEKGLKYVID